jgi:hypothetical protein
MDFAGQTSGSQSTPLSTELPSQNATPFDPNLHPPRWASLQGEPTVLAAASSLAYTENGAPILIGSTISLPNGLSSLTVSNATFVSGESTEDWLTIQAGNNISLNGSDIKFAGQKIGTYRQIKNGFSSTQLLINFDNTASQSAKQALVGQIAYSSTSDRLPTTSQRVLEFRNGSTLIGSTEVTLQGVNDTPAWSRDTVLYKASGSNTPSNSGWLELQQYDGTAVQDPAVDGAVLVSNNPANAGYAGYTNHDVDIKTVNLPFPLSGSFKVPYFTQTSGNFNLVNSSFPTLDRTQGYRLNFNADLRQESRINSDRNGDGNDDRAGFSILITSDDKLGIELGFQRILGSNQESLIKVFAQDDGATQENRTIYSGSVGASNLTLFTQAESSIIPYGGLNQLTAFSLAIQGDLYTLFANESAILSGRLRDYSNVAPVVALPLGVSLDTALQFAGLTRDQINPYTKKNFLFIGDNTSDAQATVKLNNISITTNATTPIPGLSVAEDQPIALPALGDLTDLDSAASLTTLVVEATHGKITFNNAAFTGAIENVNGNGTNVVTFTGSLNQLRALVAATGILSYQGNSNFNGADTINVSFKDVAIGGTVQTASRNIPVTVTTVSDSPTDITLSSNSISNQAPIGSKVGDLGAIDPDGDTTFNYSLLNNAGGKFSIVNNELVVNGVLGAAGSQTIRVQVTDPTAKTFEKDLTINVTAAQRSQNFVVFHNRGTDDLAWWNLNGTELSSSGNFQLESGITLPKLPQEWQLISNQFDFNNDSIKDFVWFNRQTTETAIWFMKVGSQGVANVIGNNSSSVYLPGGTTPFQPLDNWRLVQAGDLLGDSRPEFLWENLTSGLTSIWQLNIANNGRVELNLNTSGAITLNDVAKTPIATGGRSSGWRVIGMGNFDGNAATKELLWFNDLSSESIVWQLTGKELSNSGNITLNGTKIQPGTAWKPVAIANIDKTGNDEIIWQSATSIAIWELGNNFALTPKTTIALSNLTAEDAFQGVAEFNADNTLDLVIRRKGVSNDPTFVHYLDSSNFQVRSSNPNKAITLIGETVPIQTGDRQWDITGISEFDLSVLK